MAAVNKITVTYSSGPSQSAEVTSVSNMVIDGVRVGSGGDRPLYKFGPNSFAGPNAGFLGTGGVQTMSLAGSTLTITELYRDATTTTTITVDSNSSIVVDGVPNRNSAGFSLLNTGTVKLPLALASSVAYAA